MTRAPLVTTVIPSYNHARYVAEAVRSAWAQEYPNQELVAVDDGSSDGSVDILRLLAAESPIPMRVIAREDNRGLSATLNEGIAMSQAPYINIFASDDRILPNKLTDLVGALEAAEARTGLAFGDRRFIDPDGNVLAGQNNSQPGEIIVGQKDDFAAAADGDAFMAIVTGRLPIPAPAIVYRREVFEALGGFREDVALEDYDMLLKIASAYTFAYVPGCVVEYRIHPEQTRVTQKARLAYERVEIFDRWVERYPGLQSPQALRAARAYLYSFVGGEFYRDGDRAEARRWLLKSLALDPSQSTVWSVVARSVVGPRVVRSAKAVRDRVRALTS